MDRESQPKVRKLRRIIDACLSLLIVAACVLILWFVQIQGEPPNKAKALLASCASRQSRLCKMMQMYDTKRQAGRTVADWFQAAWKDRQASSPLPEKEFFCTKNRQPYLVFSVSASVMFDESFQKPVPILMCPPGAHGKLGSNVLYSDGTVRKMTAEEAERIVAKQSPKPLRFSSEN